MLGPNGSGKTTTIRAIFRMVPYEGEIRNYASSTGWMPQNSPLYRNLTIEENLRFFAEMNNLKNAKSRIEEMLRLVQLERYRDRLVRNLSGGMRQRAMLACAMVHDPELLILDEPTAGVDPPLRASFWQQFQELKKEGKTILVTTHYMDEAEKCERVVMIREGLKFEEGSPDEIKRRVGGEKVHLWVDDFEKAMKILSDYEVSLNDHLIVETKNASFLLPELLEKLSTAGLKVFMAEVSKLTLEDVFIKLMGEF